jgi:transposase
MHDSRFAEVIAMPQALSNDLRERVVAFVEAGNSCHEAARHFDTSVSFAINLMALYRKTGSVAPRPNGERGMASLTQSKGFCWLMSSGRLM